MQSDLRDVRATEASTPDELARNTLKILSQRRWWFIFAAIVVMSAAIIVTRHERKEYRATASVFIDKQPPRVLAGVSEVVDLGATGYWGTQQYYQSQVQIMRSRDVAQLVVDRLGLATDRHFLGLDRTEGQLSPEDEQAVIAQADPAGALAGRVQVDLSDASMIATISIEDTDPQVARDLANAVAEVYRDRNLEQKRRAVRDAYADLRAIVDEMARKKDEADQKLIDFEMRNNLSKSRQEAANEQVLTLHRQLSQAVDRRFAGSERVKELRKYRNDSDIFATGTPTLMDNRLLGELKSRYLELSIAKKELESSYLNEHPKVQTIDRQLGHVLATGRKHLNALYTSATVELNSAIAQERALQTRLGVAEGEEQETRMASIQHERLVAQRDDHRTLYEKVAKRLAETDLTSQVGVNNIRILDEAVTPRVPVRPKVRLNMAIGLILSLLIGTSVAVGVHILDNTIKGREDVEQILKVPYLGAIPTFSPSDASEGAEVPEGKLDLYAHFRPNSRVAEASRSLRTNLLFMRPEKPLRTFVVTSADPREGKTSTSTTLAIALASASGNCILVDTDLRKPRLHKVFGQSNSHGLTTYILNGGSITQYISKTDVPGLDLLACGPLPPNTSEILHTERFRHIAEVLCEHYENVIFDSPPVEIVSDALIISSQVDGVVLVAHAEASRRESVASAIRSLRSVNANLLGIVLSRTSTSGAGYGYYYGRGKRRYGPYRYRYATAAEDDAAARESDNG